MKNPVKWAAVKSIKRAEHKIRSNVSTKLGYPLAGEFKRAYNETNKDFIRVSYDINKLHVFRAAFPPVLRFYDSYTTVQRNAPKIGEMTLSLYRKSARLDSNGETVHKPLIEGTPEELKVRDLLRVAISLRGALVDLEVPKIEASALDP
jgi:hypothetical protein